MALDYQDNNVKKAIGIVQHYNPKKYWAMREYVISVNGGGY